MGVRVWGLVADLLVELLIEPVAGGQERAISIDGLPADTARTTALRVTAALVNSGVIGEAPSVAIRLLPPISDGPSSELDLAVAVATLVGAGRIDAGRQWILAVGRLGLDGTVRPRDGDTSCSLADVVRSLCQTPGIESEHVFEHD